MKKKEKEKEEERKRKNDLSYDQNNLKDESINWNQLVNQSIVLSEDSSPFNTDTYKSCHSTTLTF